MVFGVHTHTPWAMHITGNNVAEELSVLINDLDTTAIKVCCQDPTFAVRSDATWVK